MLPVLVPVVTHLTEISFVANGPTVITDVSIKIILKKYLHFLKCHVSNLIFLKATSDKNNIKISNLIIF